MAARKSKRTKAAPRSRRRPSRRIVEKTRPTARTKSPFVETLRAVQRFLALTKRPGLIIGGVAVIARGFARATIDIDATVATSVDDVDHLIALAARLKLVPRIDDASQFARDNLVLLLEHAIFGVPVDVSLALQPFEVDAAKHPEWVDFGGVRIPVPSLTALFIYKMVASRPQDVRDVEALLTLKIPFDSRLVLSTLAEFDSILETNRTANFQALLRRSTT